MGTRSNEQYTLLTDYDIHSAYSEAYRTLYANICLDWHSDHAQAPQSQPQPARCHTLLLTTPTLSASTEYVAVATNLAIVAAQSGTLTILLSLQTTFVPGLRLLGAGIATERAANLMLSPKLEAVIRSICRLPEETEIKTSIVIFHGPPVLSSADASLIGALVERTFLTIAEGHTTRIQAKQAQEQLEHAHVKLAGIITSDS